MKRVQAVELTRPDGARIGRFRAVEVSDEHEGADPLCECGGALHENPTTAGHETPGAALSCPVVREKLLARHDLVTSACAACPTHDASACENYRLADADRCACSCHVLGDLARLAFEAYGVTTGGKTWDGKPIPPFDEIRARTPHVARAWEAATTAVLVALHSRDEAVLAAARRVFEHWGECDGDVGHDFDDVMESLGRALRGAMR